MRSEDWCNHLEDPDPEDDELVSQGSSNVASRTIIVRPRLQTNKPTFSLRQIDTNPNVKFWGFVFFSVSFLDFFCFQFYFICPFFLFQFFNFSPRWLCSSSLYTVGPAPQMGYSPM
jgi:hypothetical protein